MRRRGGDVQVYGRTPEVKPSSRVSQAIAADAEVFDGLATRKQIPHSAAGIARRAWMICRPDGAEQHPRAGAGLPWGWREPRQPGSPSGSGSCPIPQRDVPARQAPHWPLAVGRLLKRGYAVASFHGGGSQPIATDPVADSRGRVAEGNSTLRPAADRTDRAGRRRMGVDRCLGLGTERLLVS